MSATKRTAGSASRDHQAGFDLSTIFGEPLHVRLESLLNKFSPSESLLPINVSFLSWLWLSISYFATQDKANGIVWFLRDQIVKEIVWYLAFKPHFSSSVSLTLNDLEPSAFRNAEHPPMATLALAASSVSCFYSRGFSST
jgi:hypothetical protein